MIRPRTLIDLVLALPSTEAAAELLGTWHYPGWRVRFVAEAEAPDAPRVRLQWLARSSRVRVFFREDHALDGRILAGHRIDWGNGTTWYKDAPLYSFEQRIHSQNGEDGVTLALLDALGITAPTALEFGVEDGTECNTRILVERGHRVVQWDRDHDNPARGLHRAFVTVDNLPELVERDRVPRDLDVLSIDVDYYDFYFWWRIAGSVSPRIVIIEVNVSHPADEDRVVRFEGPDRSWDGTRYFGASLLALARLGRRLGYTLVYAEQRGVNAFFVRDDLVEPVRPLAPHLGDVARLWRPAMYGSDGGHPVDPLRRRYTSSEAVLGAPAPWEPGWMAAARPASAPPRVVIAMPLFARVPSSLAVALEAVQWIGRQRTAAELHLVIKVNRLTVMSVADLRAEVQRRLDDRIGLEILTTPETSVAGAWNEMIAQAVARGDDYLLAINHDSLLEADTVEALVSYARVADEDVLLWSAINVCDHSLPAQHEVSDVPDFSCFMVDPRRFVRQFGRFDENFSPIYFADNDAHARIVLGGLHAVRVHAARYYHRGSDVIRSDSAAAAACNVSFARNQDYFVRKWGRPPVGSPAEMLRLYHPRPFGDPAHGLGDWTAPAELFLF
jgi:hypothetical protein